MKFEILNLSVHWPMADYDNIHMQNCVLHCIHIKCMYTHAACIYIYIYIYNTIGLLFMCNIYETPHI